MLLSERRWMVVLCGGVLACFATGSVAATVTNPNSATVPQVSRFSVAERGRRLVEKAMRAGSPVMVRIFKKESELELWMQREGRFELFEIYPICFWSGKLGPKTREGDRQTPEGFYSVDVHQLRLTGKNARSFYIDFPNTLDRALGRSGSAIMVHGRCKSIGCFAMTNEMMEEIYDLVEHALREGQDRIEVHAFPFRMTEATLMSHAESEWYGFWLNLKEGYDLFEQTRVPPKIGVCGGKYVLDTGDVPGHAPISDIDAPPVPRACEIEGPAIVSAAVGALATGASVRMVAPRQSRVIAGRNARKAYAAARLARMAAYARRSHTRASAGRMRQQ